jgi:hypothetical protein
MLLSLLLLRVPGRWRRYLLLRPLLRGVRRRRRRRRRMPVIHRDLKRKMWRSLVRGSFSSKLKIEATNIADERFRAMVE